MDEGAWQRCTQLLEMLPVVERWMSDRKRRLFAVACCSRFLQQMPDERSKRALEVAELFADGLASPEERLEAEDGAVDVHIVLRESRFSDPYRIWSRQAELLTQAAVLAVAPGIYYARDAADCVRRSILAAGRGGQAEQEEEAIQCRLLREIVGPLASRGLERADCWLHANDSAVEKIAHFIYETRSFDDLPILADALEEAGCNDRDILDHCRSPGLHVRGCWVLDLLLAKDG